MCVAAALVAAMLALPASAQSSFTVQASTATAFGNLAAAATGNTVFRMSVPTSVSVVSGAGGNVPSGTKTASTITIRCTSGNNAAQTCTQASHNTVSVRVGPRTLSNTTRMNGLAPSNFTVTAGAGTTISNQRTGTDGALIFDMTGWTNSGTGTTGDRTFNVGLDMPILGDGNSTATTATGGYYVSVLKGAGATPAASGTNVAISGTVRRNLTVAKVTDLVFGNVRLPTVGTGTVTMPTASNTRTVANGAAALGGITATRAQFTITGQGSTAVAMSVSASPLTLTSGTDTVSTTLVLSATTGTLAAGGTLTVYVGGTVTLPSTAVGGSYSGSFNFTASYN
ncbi:MAG: DUF4402 domain-containing protein [Bradyrhizobium sp.]|uniref:DUF4402 domain-containing protein n=1 Tax=Bradyrhizobium sp. TaxID=376 RepID=UPI0025C114C2|nr:DUF4402 domain-containing protein [Bradyrhizobium sp.]MCA3580309.1 DUF4402 domain-containing protein [Bradyrhizobium sp.]